MLTKSFSSTLVPRALIFSALAGVPTMTWSESAQAQDEEALMEARGKFQRAIELEHAQNWAAALKLFRQVGQIKMTPQVRYHIATCEENLGQLVAALGGYEIALAQSEGMHPDFIADVQGSIDDLKARIPKLMIERGEGADAASFELDGVAIGASQIGQEIPLNPGPHAVTASAPGFEPFSATVEVSEGSVETLTVTLIPNKKGGGGSGGGSGPADEGGQDFGLLPYIVGGAGIGVAAVGGVFLGLSQAKVSKLKDDSLCGAERDCNSLEGADREEAEKLYNGAKTFETVGWIGVGVGVAALATGTVLFVLDKGGPAGAEASVGMRVQPYALGSDAGISFVGTF
jgi:hypothetical protein